MKIHLGMDVGAVGVRAALVLPTAQAGEFCWLDKAPAGLRRISVPADAGMTVLVTDSRRTRGRPLDVANELLNDILGIFPAEQIADLMLTGIGGCMVAETLAAQTCNEFQACARAVSRLHPDVRTVFEIGGESSRYLRLEPEPGSDRLNILDYSTNGDCAAGTGGFLDQQAARLKYPVEEIGAIVAQTERAAQIAGRCSVFAKSDMIHAQQKGYKPPEVLHGLCNTVATNFKSAIVKGHVVQPPVLLLGGVAANTAVVAALRAAFELNESELLVPDGADALGAVGAALLSADSNVTAQPTMAERLQRLDRATQGNGYAFPTTRPLKLDNVKLLHDRVKPYSFISDEQVNAYLGLDIGSVGTKLVLIDDDGEVIHSIFTRTDGRPIEVVTRCLRELEEIVGWAVNVRAVGSTGSGRELIGELVGADSINDEITAHKTGATFIGDRLLGKRPDTIFEIGGQDSKYISLQPESASSAARDRQQPDTVVVDFTMNEACAAGTGSFLEERSAELGVSIKDEFSEIAFSSKAPIKLGERCTVFMERDVNTYMQRGAQRADIIAGLAYSIAHNYINRVVRGRPIGECIFFQGGTAYNNAVAAAFSIVCGKEIIVPPHNAVLGAIGAALLAREKINTTGAATRFRGYDLQLVDYQLREFACKGCGNQCSIQEFNVEGAKTFWGDKCSERYRKKTKTDKQAVIPDLIALRQQLLDADDTPNPPDARQTIGIPRAMYTWDLLPLWRRFFRDCGLRVVITDETNRRTIRRGLDCVVAEPCFPIIVAHGHVAELLEQEIDYLWLPNLLTSEDRSPQPDVASYVCPWGSTLPYVVRQAPAFRSWPGRILCPTLSLERGVDEFRQTMLRLARDLGVRRSVAQRAFERARAAQQQFNTAYQQAGREALKILEQTNENGMVIVGRPYNIHDSGVSLAAARKLREHYGVNVLPIDALPLDGVDVSDVCDNMYWSYGRKILAAAKLVARQPHLDIIFITNFKCGPDSFIKGFIRAASGKPFLTLQFDGHSNDAGMMTRCEAYLDSKGILRWWRTPRSKSADEILPAAQSTSRRCRTPQPG
ncbi:MAG: acyl-CoA dehydratase activase [Planctomycetota bacterium]